MRMQHIECVFHVGMPKCGSSALQSALSNHPAIKNQAGRKLKYVAIRSNGDVIAGEALKALASVSAVGYIPSVRASRFKAFSRNQLTQIAEQLQVLSSDGSLLILSNEAWGNQVLEFADLDLFEHLGLTVEVVMYVRPQVEWFNSAWWQWGAWSGRTLDRWMNAHRHKVSWFETYQAWSKVAGVSKVTIRLLPKDIVADFYTLLNAPEPLALESNKSLPSSVLRLFQKHRSLRQNAHASDIEFVLARHLNLSAGATPWILSLERMANVLSENLESNQKLMSVLERDQKAVMQNNQAWWNAEHYQHKALQSFEKVDLAQDDVENIAVSSIKALVALDEKYRTLQKQLYVQHGHVPPPNKFGLKRWLTKWF
jgi:hypothetical protein